MSKSESFMLPAGFWRTVARCLTGSIVLALVTLVCFLVQVNPTTAALLYLIVIVLVSLMGDFSPSALVSILAILSLDYFFTPPLFSLAMSEPLDIVAIAAFLTTSAVITHLVSSLRSSAEVLRRRETYLADAQRLSNTGSFGWSILSGEIYWSDETFRIFGYDRATTPTLELVL